MALTQSSGDVARPRLHRDVKATLRPTPHPAWCESMLTALQPEWRAVIDAPLFAEGAKGSLSEDGWRKLILDFFCIIEAFPKYMGVTLAKTTYGRRAGDFLARDWLIGNIRVEALHVQWYLQWAEGHGLSADDLIAHRPGPEVAALYEWLWSVAHRGTLAEAIGAINYAVEGLTGELCREVLPAFRERYGAKHRALQWLMAHAEYDDAHPSEALEIVKQACDPSDTAGVESAIRRSLELFARGARSCYSGETA